MGVASGRSVSRVCLAALLALSATAALAAEPGVLVALDSSRSLSAAESRAAATLARELVVRFGATAPAGALTFDDSVHWLARPGEQGAEAALDAVRPSGRFTVMNDGLIEGVRALADGGVLVLISDGVDENSATTAEDVARLASERGVRVVTIGAGRVDERAMKRLALLTGGSYAGASAAADADALSAEVESLRRQVAAERTSPPAAAPPPVEVAVSAVPAAVPAPVPEPVRDNSRILLLVGALVATLGVVIGFLLARRKAPAPAERAPVEPFEGSTKPGLFLPEPPASHAPASAPESPAEPIDEIQLARIKGRPPVAPGGLMEISLDEAANFQRLPFSESIERTLVLTEEVAMTVREPGRDARTFRLPPGRAVDVGRDAKRNTLAFHDPTLSVQHLRLTLEEGEVFLVDLGSTNGVLYKERRVDSARVYPGEKFRAGMIEFEINLHRASMS